MNKENCFVSLVLEGAMEIQEPDVEFGFFCAHHSHFDYAAAQHKKEHQQSLVVATFTKCDNKLW